MSTENRPREIQDHTVKTVFDTRRKNGYWMMGAALLILILVGTGAFLYNRLNTNQQHNIKTISKQDRAIKQLSSDSEKLAARLRELGQNPATVAPPPVVRTENVPPPKDGQDGRGIVSTQVVSGFLNVTYSDGTTQNAGPVVGKNGSAGPAGKTGPVGPVGPAGPTGKPGAEGDPGSNGSNGRGIVDADLTENGHLVLTYSDGTSDDLGSVVGRDGTNGTDGKDGVDGKNAYPFSFTFTVPGDILKGNAGDQTYRCTIVDPAVTATCEKQENAK